jgi:3-oxoadipate CoA-transferase beta subunit
VQVDEIVEAGVLDADQIHTPGVFVKSITKGVSKTHIFDIDQEELAIGEAIGKRLAADIPGDSVVELGYGMPWYVTNFLQDGKEIVVHSEGLIGPCTMQTTPTPQSDTEWRGADGKVLNMLPGSASMDFVDSFALITTQKIDYAVLGAFQADAEGSFAGWITDDPDRLPAPGASIELALCSRNVYVIMKHLDSRGQSRILNKCTFPVTARNVVKRIYTDFATLEVTAQGLRILGIHNGMTHSELEAVSGVTFL